jgi:hypothetical protein
MGLYISILLKSDLNKEIGIYSIYFLNMGDVSCCGTFSGVGRFAIGRFVKGRFVRRLLVLYDVWEVGRVLFWVIL